MAGAPKSHAQTGHVTDFVDHGGHMQQGFGRNAADVQANATQTGIAFDQHHFQPQVGGAEGC